MYKLVPERRHAVEPETFCQSFKQFFLHMLFELIGVIMMTLAFKCAMSPFMVQGGYFLALLIVTKVSGGLCNPAITFACMFRRDDYKMSVKQGLSYMFVQYLGGFCGALISLLIQGEAGVPNIQVEYWFSCICTSVLAGFIIVFMYISQTNRLTSFTEEIWLSLFIVAGCYLVGALIASQALGNEYGLALGTLVSGNPAIDFGMQMVMLFKYPGNSLKYIWLFPCVPLGGGILAILFNDLLYKPAVVQAEEIDAEIQSQRSASIANDADFHKQPLI